MPAVICKYLDDKTLKRAKVPNRMLVKIFESYVLPSIEYCSVVYGPLLSESESEKLEHLQRSALRIIYGYKMSYKKLLKTAGLETLKKRRKDLSLIHI